jgi:hypothetical protein
MRCVLMGIVAIALVSCDTPVAVNRRTEAPSTDPGITGHRELISRFELHDALVSAWSRLATLAPWSPIFRVIVIAPTRLEAYYSADYDRDRVGAFYQNHPRNGYLVLERIGAEWHVLPGREPKVIDDGRYIITG